MTRNNSSARSTTNRVPIIRFSDDISRISIRIRCPILSRRTICSVQPPLVSTTGRKELKEVQDHEQELYDQRQKEVAEMFGDQLDVLHDTEGLELPEELREDAVALKTVGKKAETNG